MKRQRTTNSSTPWLEGLHLDQDASSRVRFHPAGADEGIIFVRSDISGGPEIACLPENLHSMPRWTALQSGNHWVHHTEHVLAALALAGIDNARVEMDSDRLPMMPGGACEKFFGALRLVGLKSLESPRIAYFLKEPVFLLDHETTTGHKQARPSLKDGRYVIATPSDRFAVSCVFHWSHMPELPVGVAEFEADEPDIDPGLLSARSFLVESEKAHVRDLLGPVQDHVMMLFPGCAPALCAEAARHKIVDFIGDMYVLGRPLIGQFIAFRAGHRIHHDLIRHVVSHNLLELRSMFAVTSP